MVDLSIAMLVYQRVGLAGSPIKTVQRTLNLSEDIFAGLDFRLRADGRHICHKARPKRDGGWTARYKDRWEVPRFGWQRKRNKGKLCIYIYMYICVNEVFCSLL